MLKTNLVDIPLEIPRYHNSSFEPVVVVQKHQRMSSRIEHAIVTMYFRGMTKKDIEETIKDIYGINVSESSIFNITNTIK
ncbi:MAG TPA: transposase [Bacteroidales bacterium]|nr:transposase [Bacteroidales bacterium]HOK74322.1 transposase [Bacteroidales bacterium]HOM39845.1 transposase [Bacteroidales bacterium]HOU30225.1 transposase [Bacteroidales bacterium]HPP92786.1 transposase [Bacteroidales bacterium]